MKKACHCLLKAGFIMDIVAAVVMVVLSLVMFIAAASIPSETSPEMLEQKYIYITMGCYLIFLVPLMIVGFILAKKGLAKTEANQETVGFGVCLAIFSFIPAGVLYIICATKNNNNSQTTIEE